IGLSLQKTASMPLPAAENHQTESNHNRHKQPGLSLQRDIADYLLDEVYSQQSPDIQHFLLLSAAVPRFTAGLCNALRGRNDSLAVISHLDRHNLFLLPLDNHGVWFRYHDLFRRFLLQHFNNLNTEVRQQGRNTAAQWFEQNGYLQEALEQRLQLRDWNKAEALLLQLLASDDEINSLLPTWLASFPPEHSVHQHVPQIQNQPHTPLSFDALLTSREQQVLALVSQGHPNKEIARQLHISLNTLKVHIRNLYGKIGVENRTEALHKLLSQDDRSPYFHPGQITLRTPSGANRPHRVAYSDRYQQGLKGERNDKRNNGIRCRHHWWRPRRVVGRVPHQTISGQHWSGNIRLPGRKRL